MSAARRRFRRPALGFRRRLPSDPLTAEAAALCRAVAPADLAGMPVYVLRRSRLPPGLGGDIACSGFTGPAADIALQDVIGPAWSGRGPCMICDDEIRGWGEGLSESQYSRRPQFLAVAAHELAHVLERDRPYFVPQALTPAQVREAAARSVAEMGRRDSDSFTPETLLAGHGPQFFRLVQHVVHRAAAAGWGLALDMVQGHWFELSPFAAYRAAAGDEPERMARASFRDIRATPIPPQLVRLWTSDVERIRAEIEAHRNADATAPLTEVKS